MVADDILLTYRENLRQFTGGQRFLVNAFADQTTPQAITVVLNWTAGLKR
jgi:hypothetical protein